MFSLQLFAVLLWVRAAICFDFILGLEKDVLKATCVSAQITPRIIKSKAKTKKCALSKSLSNWTLNLFHAEEQKWPTCATKYVYTRKMAIKNDAKLTEI